MVQVRESSRFGPCYALGELIGETATRYIYRNRARVREQKLVDPPRTVRRVRRLSKGGGLVPAAALVLRELFLAVAQPFELARRRVPLTPAAMRARVAGDKPKCAARETI
jgi:hypothetical protein